MPRSIESIVSCHQVASARRRAGRPIWDLVIPIKSVRDRHWCAQQGLYHQANTTADAATGQIKGCLDATRRRQSWQKSAACDFPNHPTIPPKEILNMFNTYRFLRRAVLASAVALVMPAMAQSYHYEPEQTILAGVLTRETGESPDGQKVSFPAIRLPRAITVQGNEETPTEKGVVLLHVILGSSDMASTYKRLLGKKVDITGKLMHSENGHHQTDVLIRAERIEPAR